MHTYIHTLRINTHTYIHVHTYVHTYLHTYILTYIHYLKPIALDIIEQYLIHPKLIKPQIVTVIN